MCGHGTIGLVATLAYLGRIQPGHTPSKRRWAPSPRRCTTAASSRRQRARVRHHRLRSRCPVRAGAPATWPGAATGSSWCRTPWRVADAGATSRLTDFAWAIRQALEARACRRRWRRDRPCRAVRPDDGRWRPAATSCSAPAAPTTARPAAPAPAPSSPAWPPTGKLAEGEAWVQESVIGSTFTGRYRREGDRIMPIITGTAFVNADLTQWIDERDPFAWGIRH
jgi:4-hydroxyproline epimerase